MFRTCLLLLLSMGCLSTYAQQPSSFLEQIQATKAIEDHAVALSTLDRLITVAGELGYVDTVALLHHRKGVTYSKMDDMEAAIAATQKAIALRADLADTTGLGQSYYNLAYFYEWNNQARQALEAFERAVQLGDGPKNTFFFYAIIP
ncbi:MAG: tetratricopeptide repeat protein, partial [Bacteroidota bacterium]